MDSARAGQTLAVTRAKPVSGRVFRRLLGLSSSETTFVRRGFNAGGDPAARARLEAIGGFFLAGYHAALEAPDAQALVRRLDAEIEAEPRGFAYEGAAMGLAMLGLLLPWRWRRVQEYLDGPAAPHVYIAHVGVGWALATLPVRHERVLRRLHPLWRWLAMDGFGFDRAYFDPRRTLRAHAVPGRLAGYARRAFDQGVGRALWFVEGADVRRVAGSVRAFAEPRQADLWAGVGLACAYAGGVEDEALRALRDAAGTCGGHLAQGVCFAAETRDRARNPAPQTERASRVVCGLPAPALAQVTRETGDGLPSGDDGQGYEEWRRRIRRRLSQGGTQ